MQTRFTPSWLLLLHKATSKSYRRMSAFGGKADIVIGVRHVRK